MTENRLAGYALILCLTAGMILPAGAEAVSNVSWHAPSRTLSPMFQAGALTELSRDAKTAFEIDCDIYDIYELPSLRED